LSACGDSDDPRGVEALEFAAAVLGAIRKKKSEEQRPLKTPVARALVRGPSALLALLPDIERDLCAAGLIQRLETAAADALQVEVELSSAEPSPEERRP